MNWIGELAILDRSQELIHEVWQSFALDELLSEQAARDELIICHLWCHPSAVILGQRDSRLPYVEQAIDELEHQGYQTCIRHSGGAAVPLDKQVLNISLIFPVGKISESSYDDGFEKMYELLTKVSSNMPYKIEKGEIEGAYCPGTYDLSVNGLKFCGIAQRRKLKAYIVQAFVNIDGDSVKRAELIKQFYTTAVKEQLEADYPTIIPNKTASLSQFGSMIIQTEHTLQEEPINEIQAFIARLKATVQKMSIEEHAKHDLIALPSEEQIETQINKLKQRYKLSG